MERLYADGVVKWRNIIPPHWELFRFRYLFSFSRGINITKADLSDEGVPCVTYGDIHSRYGFELNPNKHTLRCVGKDYLALARKSMLDKGDFIFADTSEDVEGSGNFTYLDSETKTVAGYHTIIAKPKNPKMSRYIAYVFDSIPFRTQIRSKVYGIKVFSITQAILKDAVIPIPPIEEQRIIVNHLDLQTSVLDNILLDLARQTNMLEHYKRELIANVFTHGLDKSVPRKDSGVDWIGSIPTSWELFPLFAVAKENKIKNTGLVCSNLLSLSYGRIVTKDIDSAFGLLPESFEGYQIVQPGYTVLRLTDLQNDKRSLRTGYTTETGIITSAYMGLIPGERLDSKYFAYLLHAYDLLKIYYGFGSGLRQSLKFNDMKRLPVLVPPMPEQKHIVAYIDTKTSQINTLIADISKQIQRLKQYRQIVIHNAVTGKIKVTEG